MGRNRQREQAQQRPAAEAPYEEIALALSAAAAASEAGGIASASAIVAALVGLGVPETVARAVPQNFGQEIPEVDGTTGILRMARVEQIVYRALFVWYSARRIQDLTLQTRDPVALRRQLEKEQAYFESHLVMNRKREDGAARILEAMERWGEVLSWNAVIRPTNRPHHRSAHRMNWQPLLGPPILTGAYPGTLPFCLCYAGAPVAGARMLV